MNDDLARGRFTVIEDGADGDTLDVHFNPETLELTVTNSMEDSNEGSTTQYVSQTSAKLGLSLVFDTSHSGDDVRDTTVQLIRWMGGFQSREQGGDPSSNEVQREPKVLRFDWGSFTFKGFIEAYKETLSFFSKEGVPLRSGIALTLTQQSVVFEDGDDPFKRDGVSAAVRDTIELAPAGGSASDVAGQGGDPGAARAIASQNGLESLRAGVGGSLTVSAGVSVGVQASAGASALLGSAAASARVSAAGGAFAGIRTGADAGLGRFKASRVRDASLGGAAGASTRFAPGGRAVSRSGKGLSADVGQGTSLSDRLRFEEGQ